MVLHRPIECTALSLTRPAFARAFRTLTNHDRTHFFVGARIASGFGACVHLRHPTLLSPLRSSIWCCPPVISSIINDHDEFSDLPFQGGGKPNQSASDFRTITRSRHPRTGITTFLLPLSTTTELVVLNTIPQHNPHPDSQLASHGCSRLPETFLD